MRFLSLIALSLPLTCVSVSAQAQLMVSHLDANFSWSPGVVDATHGAATEHVLTCGAITNVVPMPNTSVAVRDVVPGPGTYTCTLYAQNSAGRQADPDVPFPLFESGYMPGLPIQLSVLPEPPPPGGNNIPVIAMDNFNRSNETPLSGGGNWSLSFSDYQWNLSTNVAVPSAANADCIMHYTAGTWPNDQYSKADLTVNGTNGGDQGVGLTVRGSTVTRTYYRAIADHAESGNVSISKFKNGVYTPLVSGSASWADGATWEFRVQGTTLILLCNGVTVLSTEDGDIVAGNPGIALSSIVTSASIDNWEGGMVQ